DARREGEAKARRSRPPLALHHQPHRRLREGVYDRGRPRCPRRRPLALLLPCRRGRRAPYARLVSAAGDELRLKGAREDHRARREGGPAPARRGGVQARGAQEGGGAMTGKNRARLAFWLSQGVSWIIAVASIFYASRIGFETAIQYQRYEELRKTRDLL